MKESDKTNQILKLKSEIRELKCKIDILEDKKKNGLYNNNSKVSEDKGI